MTQELLLAVVVVLVLLLFFFWRPPSAVLRWTVLATAVLIGAAAVRYIPV